MKRWMVVLTLAAALTPSAVAQTAKPGAAPAKGAAGTAAKNEATTERAGLPTQATVDSFLKHTFGYDSTITWKVLDISPAPAQGVASVTVLLQSPQGQQSAKFFVLPGEKYAIAGDLMPFGADPFAPARNEITAKANGVVKGPENATVTVVEFSDLECPSCKAAQPTIDRLLKDEPEVKFIFQNYPLEQVHPWAFLAARYADCVAQQSKDAFWKFIESVYANQEQVTALLPQNTPNPMSQAEPQIAKKLQELAGGAGANAQQVATCSAEPATTARIRKSLALGGSLGITGTPTLFINGRKIANVNGTPYEILKSMVDAAKQAK